MPWPDEFGDFLRAMQLLTLDLNSISGFFCEVSGFDFYDGLLVSTLATLGIVSCVFVRFSVLRRKMKMMMSTRARQHDLLSLKHETTEASIRALKKALFYICIFLYPILNLRIFQTFVCVGVSDLFYLRADYSLECFTAKWKMHAAYCAVWIAVYTVGFPVGLFYFLHHNRKLIKENYQDVLHPVYKEVGFLWNDYREEYYW